MSVSIPLVPGETAILLGGELPYEVTPVAAGQDRVVAVNCYLLSETWILRNPRDLPTTETAREFSNFIDPMLAHRALIHWFALSTGPIDRPIAHDPQLGEILRHTQGETPAGVEPLALSAAQ